MNKRKNLRLQEYDYNSSGVYFITICTDRRKHFLSTISVGAIHESPSVELTMYGNIVDKIIKTIACRYNVVLDCYVIMPNHIHILINVGAERAIHESPLRSHSVISNIVGYLKMNSSKEIHKLEPDIKIWQRSYYDHIIRDEADYIEKREYIRTNPARWGDDEYY